MLFAIFPINIAVVFPSHDILGDHATVRQIIRTPQEGLPLSGGIPPCRAICIDGPTVTISNVHLFDQRLAARGGIPEFRSPSACKILLPGRTLGEDRPTPEQRVLGIWPGKLQFFHWTGEHRRAVDITFRSFEPGHQVEIQIRQGIVQRVVERFWTWNEPLLHLQSSVSLLCRYWCKSKGGLSSVAIPLERAVTDLSSNRWAGPSKAAALCLMRLPFNSIIGDHGPPSTESS